LLSFFAGEFSFGAGLSASSSFRSESFSASTCYVVVYVSIRQHTSAYVSIRQQTSAYVSIRFTSESFSASTCYVVVNVIIRHHTSSYVSVCGRMLKAAIYIYIIYSSFSARVSAATSSRELARTAADVAAT
jgi:hypothetical protein